MVTAPVDAPQLEGEQDNCGNAEGAQMKPQQGYTLRRWDRDKTWEVMRGKQKVGRIYRRNEVTHKAKQNAYDGHLYIRGGFFRNGPTLMIATTGDSCAVVFKWLTVKAAIIKEAGV